MEEYKHTCHNERARCQKNTNNSFALALQSELWLCSWIQALSRGLSAAAGGKDLALTGRAPIKPVDRGLATGGKQRSSPASLGDSASPMASSGCPCPSLSRPPWLRDRSPRWPRASCQLPARQLLPAEKGATRNRVSGVPWPDVLLPLKAWLGARLAIKLSLPGPPSPNGSPRALRYQERRRRRRLGSQPLETASGSKPGNSSQRLLLLRGVVATSPPQKPQVPWWKELSPVHRPVLVPLSRFLGRHKN